MKLIKSVVHIPTALTRTSFPSENDVSGPNRLQLEPVSLESSSLSELLFSKSSTMSSSSSEWLIISITAMFSRRRNESKMEMMRIMHRVHRARQSNFNSLWKLNDQRSLTRFSNCYVAPSSNNVRCKPWLKLGIAVVVLSPLSSCCVEFVFSRGKIVVCGQGFDQPGHRTTNQLVT